MQSCTNCLSNNFQMSHRQAKITAIIGAIFITTLMLKIFSAHIPMGLAIAADVLLPMVSTALVFWIIYALMHPQGQTTQISGPQSPPSSGGGGGGGSGSSRTSSSSSSNANQALSRRTGGYRL